MRRRDVQKAIAAAGCPPLIGDAKVLEHTDRDLAIVFTTPSALSNEQKSQIKSALRNVLKTAQKAKKGQIVELPILVCDRGSNVEILRKPPRSEATE